MKLIELELTYESKCPLFTTGWICQNPQIWLCDKELRKFFNLPPEEDLKQIWLLAHDKPAAHRAEVRRFNESYIKLDKETVEVSDTVIDLLYKVVGRGTVYVEVWYEEK